MFDWLDNYKTRKFFNSNNHKYKIIGKLNEAYSEFYETEKEQPRRVRITLNSKEKHFRELLSKIKRNASKRMGREEIIKYNSECRYLHEVYQKLDEDAKKKYKDIAACVNINAIVRIFDMVNKSGKDIDEGEIKQLINADLSDADSTEAKEFLRANLDFVEGKRKGLPKLRI